MENVKENIEHATQLGSVVQKSKSAAWWGVRALGNMMASGVKTIVSVIFILLIFSFLGNAFSGSLKTSTMQEVHVSGEGPNKIVVVPLNGVIAYGSEGLLNGSKTIVPEQVRKILSQVEGDEHVKGVILEIDSPGGSAVASDDIFETITAFKHKKKQPVVALMKDTAASGGYYIASSADKIVANPATLTGSIGVIATNLKVKGLMDKLGVQEDVYKKGLYKDIFSPTRDTTEEEKKIIDSILDDTYKLFIDRVALGRNLSPERVELLANGRIYSGKQAKEAGLVDSLGNLPTAVETTKGLAGISQAEVVRLETGGFLDQLFSGVSLGIFSRLFAPVSLPHVWFLMQ